MACSLATIQSTNAATKGRAQALSAPEQQSVSAISMRCAIFRRVIIFNTFPGPYVALSWRILTGGYPRRRRYT
jgi:hypothetical protein